MLMIPSAKQRVNKSDHCFYRFDVVDLCGDFRRFQFCRFFVDPRFLVVFFRTDVDKSRNLPNMDNTGMDIDRNI